MEQILTKPYEISIWKDKLIEGETHYEEIMLGKLGSNETSAPNECFDITLQKNVNGETKLKFSMLHQYFDEDIGKKIENPLVPFLVNERKVKLKYDGEWYDFLIKNVQEGSDDNVFEYECTDLFVNELAKGGYNVTLSTDLSNNQGTITQLAEAVMEQTDWEVAPSGDGEGYSDYIRGYVQEPLYYGKVTTAFNVINAVPSERPAGTGIETVAVGEEIYFFYSTIANQQKKNVHILRAKDKEETYDSGAKKWVIDDNKVVKAPNYRLQSNITFVNKVPNFVTDFEIVTDFQGYRITYNADSMWDPVTERYVDIYKAGDREIYHYTDYEYTTSDILTNFITNGHNFEAMEDGSEVTGWSTATPHGSTDVEQTATIVSYPTTNEDESMSLSDLSATKNYLQFHFNGGRFTKENTQNKYNTIYNSGIQDNGSLIGGFVKGEEYIFRVKYGITKKNNADGSKGAPKPEKPINGPNGEAAARKYNQHLRVMIAGYTTSSSLGRVPKANKIYFDTGYNTDADGVLNNIVKGGEIDQAKRVYRVPNDYGYDIYAPSTEKFYQVTSGQTTTSYIWDPKAINPSDNKEGAFVDAVLSRDLQYYYYKMTCKKGISSKDLMESDIGIFVYVNRTNGEQDEDPEARYYYWVEDIQLTKLRRDANGKIMTIGNIPTAASIAMDYYYLPSESVKSAEEVVRYARPEDVAEDLNYSGDIVPSYNDQCEKITSIEVEHSNYYNILQDLCEKFQCWVELKVEHGTYVLTSDIAIDEDKTYYTKENGGRKYTVVSSPDVAYINTYYELQDDGKITLDDNNSPIKKIIFHQYIGKDNFAGFKYGINLDSIQRTFASDEIVTKLIVAQNENEYAENGVLTIAQAPSNPYGTSYIYNFDYYIKQGLIDSEDFYDDLADFEQTIKEKSTELYELNQQYIDIQQKITRIGGEKVTYNEYLNAARIDLTETKKLIKEITGYSYEQFIANNGSNLRMTILPTHKNSSGKTVAAKVILSMDGVTGLKLLDKDGKSLRPADGGVIYYKPGATKDSSKHQYFKFSALPSGYTYPFKKDASGNVTGTTTKNFAFYLQDTRIFKPRTVDGVQGVYCYLPLANDDAMDAMVDYFGRIIADQTVINGYTSTVSDLKTEYNKLVQEADGAPRYTININTTNGCTVVEANDFVDSFTIKIRKPGNNVWETCIFDSVNKIFEFDFVTTQFQFTQKPSNYQLYDTNNNKLTLNYEYNLSPDMVYSYSLRPTDGTALATGGLKYRIEEKENEIKALEKTFYEKYSRFIQEGTWTSDEHINNELYYLDALQVANTSAMPKTEYSIKVLEVSELDGLHNYDFNIGDKTYIEDTEFFGWVWDPMNKIKTPVREEVIVSEVTWHLDKPEDNEITIQNYKTRFEDLFQRIGATVQTVEYNNGTYMRAASALDTNGLINSNLLSSSLSNIAGSGFLLSADGKVEIDYNGVTVTDLAQTNNKVRLGGKGLMVSDDGGQTWDIAMTPQGIDAKYIRAGAIDAGQISIIDGDNPSFRWDKSGISAFALKDDASADESAYDYSKFVRFDKYGLYGIDGIDGLTGFQPTTLQEVKDEAVFGAVWDEFFVKSKYEDGYVSMSSTDDFSVVRKNGEDEVNVIKIGKIDTTNSPTYTYELATNNIYIVTTDSTAVIGKKYYELVEGEDTYVVVVEPDADDLDSYYEYDYVETTDTEFVTGKTYYEGIMSYNQIGSPSGNPAEQGWYELDYELTTDTEITEGKTYYTYDGSSYSVVTEPRVEDLYSYYELNYANTIDTTVVSGKQYYEAVLTYNEVTPTVDGNPAEEKYFEQTYVRTTDIEIVSGKTYYTFIEGNDSYTEVVSPSSLTGLYERILMYQNNLTYYIKSGTIYTELVLTDDDYKLTTDTTVDNTKTYFVEESGGSYSEVENPVDEDLSHYYEVIINLDLEPLYIENVNLNEESVYGIIIRKKDDDENEWQFRADSEGNLELTGTARSRNYVEGISGWKIDQSGDAEFSNVSVRGSIHAAVFEYDEIQAIGGLVYIRPSTAIVTTESDGRDLILTVENPAIISSDNFCRISTELDNGIINDVYDYSYSNEVITITNYFPENISETDKLNELTHLVGAAFISLGSYDSTTGETINNFAIGINSSESNVGMPAKAITLSENSRILVDNKVRINTNYRGILGRLPALSSSKVNNDIYDNYLKGTQGLYTDNIYIGGDTQYITYYSIDDNNKALAIKASDLNITTTGNNPTTVIQTTDHGVILNGSQIIVGNVQEQHIEIDNNEFGIYSDSENKVAYIDGQKLVIPRTVVLTQMDIGQWSWATHEVNDGQNLYLKWLG